MVESFVLRTNGTVELSGWLYTWSGTMYNVRLTMQGRVPEQYLNQLYEVFHNAAQRGIIQARTEKHANAVELIFNAISTNTPGQYLNDMSTQWFRLMTLLK